VKIVGFGAPDFLHLHQSDRMVSIRAVNSSGQLPDDIVFFHDNVSMLASTTASTPQQGVEVADEGCPVLNSAGHQIAIGQATWRIKVDNTTILTFASLGPTIAYHQKYISDTLAVFAAGGSGNLPQPPNSTDNTTVQNIGSNLFVNTIMFLLLIAYLAF